MKYAWSDFGTAERVIAKFGYRVRFVRDEKEGRFTVYDDRKWEVHGADTTVRSFIWETLAAMVDDEAGEYDDTPGPKGGPSRREAFTEWAKRQQSSAAINGCFRVLQAHPAVTVWPGQFDQQRFLVNFANGTMDTNTLEFGEHDPEDYQTRMLPVGHNPSATCPKWEAFLAMNIPDAATREYIQKVVGYTLTGRSNEKIMMWLFGPANTGKSIVVNTLAKMFGQDYGVTANDGALRHKKGGGPSPELNSMKGKRYVSGSETGQGQELDEALVKRITGGDTQNSRGLYAAESNWNPECVIWVASNQFPQPRGDDDAIWGRFRPVEFPVAYGPDNPARDPRLSEKLEAELEGIANWAVEGLRKYLDEGINVLPHTMVMAAEKFRSEADPVRQFMDDAVELGKVVMSPASRCNRVNLYKLYRDWAVDSGRKPYSNRRFYERLAEVPGVEGVTEKSNGIQFVTGVTSIAPSWRGTPGFTGT